MNCINERYSSLSQTIMTFCMKPAGHQSFDHGLRDPNLISGTPKHMLSHANLFVPNNKKERKIMLNHEQLMNQARVLCSSLYDGGASGEKSSVFTVVCNVGSCSIPIACGL